MMTGPGTMGTLTMRQVNMLVFYIVNTVLFNL